MSRCSAHFPNSFLVKLICVSHEIYGEQRSERDPVSVIGSKKESPPESALQRDRHCRERKSESDKANVFISFIERKKGGATEERERLRDTEWELNKIHILLFDRLILYLLCSVGAINYIGF